ncbi:MAG: LysR family transcriptional regulator [Rhodocyclaceae bacterium]|nr:LysR family transcriptional regulator [Rhodocyclaceae bacterium]
MRPDDLNYRHLLYFWAVAKEGSITRAGERLGLSVQTISTQLGRLERQLGRALLAPQGRSLALTDAGRTVLVHAEQIFQNGERLLRALAEGETTRPRLAVGVTDAVPKLVAFRLLEATLRPPLSVRLECVEGEFDGLLSELALNRLDLVIADRSAPQQAHLKLHSQRLAEAPIALFAAADLHAAHAGHFPAGLEGAPLLLPARDDPLRTAIDTWLEQHELRPVVVGEFTDSALLKTFGRAGLGLFPAPAGMEADIAAQFGARPVGILHGVSESWYAITAQRRVQHPAVALIQSAGGGPLAG